jgi:hypothetical protein
MLRTDGSHLDEDGGSSSHVNDWVGVSEDAGFVRDALVRVISQVGGLLMLAQMSGRLDLIDAQMLERADATLRQAEAMLHFVSELNGGPHRRRLETAAQSAQPLPKCALSRISQLPWRCLRAPAAGFRAPQGIVASRPSVMA